MKNIRVGDMEVKQYGARWVVKDMYRNNLLNHESSEVEKATNFEDCPSNCTFSTRQDAINSLFAYAINELLHQTRTTL